MKTTSYPNAYLQSFLLFCSFFLLSSMVPHFYFLAILLPVASIASVILFASVADENYLRISSGVMGILMAFILPINLLFPVATLSIVLASLQAIVLPILIISTLQTFAFASFVDRHNKYAEKLNNNMLNALSWEFITPVGVKMKEEFNRFGVPVVLTDKEVDNLVRRHAGLK